MDFRPTKRTGAEGQQILEDHIIGSLQKHEAGIFFADLCRKHGISNATLYK